MNHVSTTKRIVLIAFILFICSGNGGNTAEGSYEKGLEYSTDGEFEKAKKQFEQALQMNSGDIASEESLKVIEKVLNKEIDVKAARHFFRGVYFSNKGMVEETFDHLNKAIEIAPEFSYALYERGMAFGRRGEFEKAIGDFSRVIELSPDDAAAYNNRGLAYAKGKKEYDAAFADFNRAIELDPKFAEAYDNRGIAYRVVFDNEEKACADWRRACDLKRCDSLRRARDYGYCK